MRILEFTYEDAKGKVSQKHVAVTSETSEHVMGYDVSKIKRKEKHLLVETYTQHQKAMNAYGLTGQLPTDEETTKKLKENKDDYIILITTPDRTEILDLTSIPAKTLKKIKADREAYLETMSQFTKIIRKYRTDRMTNMNTHFQK